MLRCMTAVQFLEWMIFAQLEGAIGDERADQRTASVVQALYRVNGKKGSKGPSLKECTLQFGDAIKGKAPMPWQEMMKIAKEMTAQSQKEAEYQEQRMARRRK